MAENPNDEVVDFSNYGQTQQQESESAAPSPIQPMPVNQQFIITKKIWIMIAFLILLAIAQIVILILNKPRRINIPEGYRVIQPANAPIRLEKIK